MLRKPRILLQSSNNIEKVVAESGESMPSHAKKHTWHKLLLRLTACCALTFPITQAMAAEVKSVPEYALETIYVMGTKTAEDLETIQKTTVEVKKKIDAGQINNVTDLLRDLAGFTVLFNPNSGTQVTLRGVGGERFLVSVNGNVLQNQGGLMLGRGFSWDSIPVATIQKIEIIRGASSAVYAGTWGGVINLVTIQTPGETRTESKVSYGSFNTRKMTLTHQGTTPDGKVSWVIGSSKNTSDGFYRNNWSDDKNANLDLNYKINTQDTLSFTLTHDIRKEGIITGNNAKSPNGYNPAYPVVNDPPKLFETTGLAWIDGSYRFWRTNNYALNYKTAASKINLYENTQFRTEWVRTAADPALKLNWKSDLSNRGFDWQQSVTTGNHHLAYGLQYQTMKYDLTSSQSVLDHKFSGLFVQDNWNIMPDWTIGLGARYDFYKFTMDVFDTTAAAKPYSNTANYFSPKFSITHALSSRDTVYASASAVFRPPTPADYFRWSYNYSNWSTGSSPILLSKSLGFTSQSEWQQAFGYLGPEQGKSFELGWRKQANDRFSWRFTSFYNDIDNYINILISRYTTKGYYPTYNIDNAKIKGLEFSADYIFDPNFSIAATFSRQKGTKSGDRLDASPKLKNLPENTITCGLHYQKDGFFVALDTRYTGQQYAGPLRLAGYSTTDLSFRVERGQSAISLALCNLFDKEYQEAGYTMPGRTYTVSWQQKF
ncbi:Vitamin B12 transporter BtuB precursor [Sporomusa ovata DSM 2662]|uniref:Outer membrane vitamin B12 receptor BtuB n=1 Tax=Sporomusa ovata TaxID=2378 RepID=A0A0U1KVG6_9FIRM|nr:TonB-dependent receptor [Sporomusa ovata]EQB29402.1 TonB-dependent receptor [Sporomusa ovata DSM 2662]CQR71450.1 Outer membrane vitamin B12 receptor BtuB [Sporomusa ovata]